MKVDNTPTVTRRTRPISRKLRLRFETAKLLKKFNQRSKTVRQKKKEAKANAKETDPEKHVDITRVPRIKKNKLADPPKATSKYKKRQVNKTWLPTHLWHSKRARMTRPTEPLWRMAIPLTPTEKTYRPTHRASSSRGCIAWDASYMSTVGCLGTNHTLENMLRLLGFLFEGTASRERKWRAGTRHAEGWIHQIDNGKKPIVPATVIWMVKSAEGEDANQAKEGIETEKPVHEARPATETTDKKRKVKLDGRLFIRLHPSAFQHFWLELLKAAKMQKPQVLVEDLRFEIGSIEVKGPGSTEALLGVLTPRHAPKNGSVEAVWTSLAGLSNPASLSDHAMLAFNVVDPRLTRPPKQIKLPRDQASTDKLSELIVAWPLDDIQTTPDLASHKARWVASTSLPSQKAVNRRKSEAGKGRSIAVIEQDPAIPVMLLANRSQAHDANAQGSWTVLLPWCCVDAVWRSLVYYPLSSGQTPRFGGLIQTQQVSFEHMTPWYPGDFPGTEAGKAWERMESEKRFDEWLRRPPSRRLRWDLVELGLGRRGEVGRGWTCDWEYLLNETKEKQAKPLLEASDRGDDGNEPSVQPDSSRQKSNEREKNDAKAEGEAELERRRNTSSPESDAGPEGPTADLGTDLNFSQLTPSQARLIFKSSSPAVLPPTPGIATVRIGLLMKGTPNPAARIYRLPPIATDDVNTESTNSNSTQPSTHPANSNGATSTESAPPPGQISPPTPDISTNRSSTPTTFANLREKWLSLLPPSFLSLNNSGLPKHSKQKQNHRGLPPKHIVHPYDPPTHINVLPRNAPQSIIDEFGAKPLTAEQIKEQQRDMLMKELMKNQVGPEETWDAGKGLVECPNPEDLIGYVTSGAYNLSEGRGTAVGGIWVQRVVQGWQDEDAAPDSGVGDTREATAGDGAHKVAGATKESTTLKSKRKCTTKGKSREREKHLCVIRNAGESVGRLGLWELCE